MDARTRYQRPSTIVDLQAPVSQHQLPPLAGTKISVTGFDPRAKDQLAALIARGGGAHSPELHTSCTHLIAEAAGSPKFE